MSICFGKLGLLHSQRVSTKRACSVLSLFQNKAQCYRSIAAYSEDFYQKGIGSLSQVRHLTLFILTTVVLLSASTAEGQNSTVGLDRVNGTYTTGIDNIDLASLALHIDIPLYRLKKRGSGTDVVMKMTYDSGYFDPNIDGYLNSDVGWRPGTPSYGAVWYELSNIQQCNPDPDPSASYHYGWYYQDTDGVIHKYGGETVTSPCGVSPSPLDELPIDGAPYRLQADGINGKVILPSGATLTPTYFGDLYQDSNGNLGAASVGYGFLEPVTVFDLHSSGGNYVQDAQGNTTGRNPLLITYKDSAGTQQTITVSYVMRHFLPVSSIDYQTPNCVATLGPMTGMVDRITFPDTSYYSFTYQDSWQCPGAVTGNVATMKLPTGGIISYTFPDIVSVNDLGSFQSLTRTGPDGATTYQRVITDTESNGYPRAWTTNITKSSDASISSDLTSITFVGGVPHRGMETGRKVYQGSGGTPLLETHRCYNGATGDCTNSAFYLPVTQIDETRSMNGASPTRTVTSYNLAHLVTEVDEYDFGASSVLRKTLTSYASLGNNIADRPSSIIVKDGGGNTVKQTNFSYDLFSLATPNGSTPNLESVSGARGNLSQKDEWTGSGYISTYYHYDTAGQLVSETDPRGNTTNYLYDETTDTVVKSIALPDTNNGSTHHVTTFTINPNTLFTDTKVDENGIHTDFVYDSMLRNTVVKSAKGTSEENWQNTSYSSTTQTVSKQDLNSVNDQALVSTVNMDSYGRTQHTIDTAGSTIDSIYDIRGRLLSISNPHGSSSASTDGITSYQYDALDRKTLQTTTPDGSTFRWDYNSNAVTITDESGRKTKQVSDALGRLTDVYEDPTGTNLHTSYSYDLLNNLTGVNQQGKTRQFSYDSMSQLTQAYNPETGWVCFGTMSSGTIPNGSNCIPGYDGNGNLQYKTDSRGVTTNFTYDALNRLTSKTYSGEKEPNGSATTHPTPATCYLYDSETNAGSNPIGRLVAEWTQSGGCTQGSGVPSGAISWKDQLSYDAVGRLTDGVQCAFAPCTASAPIEYRYDLAGNVIYSANGLANSQTPQVGWTNHYDNAGHLDKVTSNWVDPTHPDVLFQADTAAAAALGVTSGSAYSPFGGLAAALYGINTTTTNAAALSDARTYDNRSRLTAKNVYGNAGSTVVTTHMLLSITPSTFTTAYPATVAVHVDCNTACGDVNFTADGTLLGAVPLDENGNISFSTSGTSPAMQVGPHSLQVDYVGDATHAPSTDSKPYKIVDPTQFVTVSMSQQAFTLGENPRVDVQVACGSACGQVELTVDGASWFTLDLDNNGHASLDSWYWYWLNSNFVPGQNHALAAHYLGNSGFAPAVSSDYIFTLQNFGTQQVKPVPSMSKLSFTVSMNSIVTVHHSCNTSCGQVTLTIDGNYWLVLPLDSNGNASTSTFWWSSQYFTVNNHQLVAHYLGNATYAPMDSDPQPFTVQAIGTQPMAVTLNMTPLTFSTTDHATASVQLGCNTNCGLVELTIDGNRWWVWENEIDANGNLNIDKVNWGWPSAYNVPGNHMIQAIFLGNATYAQSSSSPQQVTVTP